jgi:hypothetical protein
MTHKKLTLIKAINGNMLIFQKLYEERKAWNKLITVISHTNYIFSLNKKSLLNVLNFFHVNIDERIHLVSKWAFFVKHGYFGYWAEGEVNLIQPERLLINYENEHEDKITDIISRLDEMGDEIDGIVTKNEIEEFISSLS